MTDAVKLVAERGKTHGDFAVNARVAQWIKSIIRVENVKRERRGQAVLNDTQMYALDMIAAKIGRIFAGDPNFQDHWDDIAGYAYLANKSSDVPTTKEKE